MVARIESADDPRVELFRDVRDKDVRGRGDLFIGEQLLILEKMLQHEGMTRSILVSDAMLPRVSELDTGSIPVHACSRNMLEQITGIDLHRGVLAAGERGMIDRRRVPEVMPAGQAPATILACDRISNIDNIGMLFRTAAALGVSGVLLSRDCHDPLYRKSLRVSVGHALNIPYAWCDDLPDSIRWARSEMGFVAIGTSIQGQPVRDVHPGSLDRTLIVVGNEYEGVDGVTLAACDHSIRIPMADGVDSLNVATAAGILLDRYTRGERR